MIPFLMTAGAMTLLAVALVLRALTCPRLRTDTVSWAAMNATIYAAELALLDHDLRSGVLTAEAHRAARDEVLRRALVEEGQHTITRPASAGWWAPFVSALAVPAVAASLYLLVGNPGAVLNTVTATAPATGPVTVATLQDHLRYAPRDGRAWVLLARLHMDADRFGAAAQAYEQAIAAAPKIARDPQVWCEFADALGMAQGGSLRGRPRELIEQALVLGPRHPRALEMAGSAAYEARDYRATLRYWSDLLSQLALGSPERRELETAIARVRAQMPDAR